MLRDNDKIHIKQWYFSEGSVEKIGTILKGNFGKLSVLLDEAAKKLNLSAGGVSKKSPKECSLEYLLLETWNASSLLHRPLNGANYEIEVSGLVVGGFTQPEIAF